MSEQQNGQQEQPTAPSVPQNARTGTSDDFVESAFVTWWGEYRPGQYLYDSALNVWRTARTADAERIAALEGSLAEARRLIEFEMMPRYKELYEPRLGDAEESVVFQLATAYLARPSGIVAARVIAAAIAETEAEDAQDKAWKSTAPYDTQHWDYREEESRANRRAAVDAYRVRS